MLVIGALYWVLLLKSDGKKHLEDSGVAGRIILSRIFRKWDVVAWTGLIWLKIGTGRGHF
jgi:hypothetical protein